MGMMVLLQGICCLGSAPAVAGQRSPHFGGRRRLPKRPGRRSAIYDSCGYTRWFGSER